MNKKVLIGSLLVILIIAAGFGLTYYQKIFGKAVTKDGAIYIRTQDSMIDVKHLLEEFLEKPEDFNWVADKKKFNTPKGGKYILKKGMSLNDLVNLLRSGKQTPIKIAFNNQDTLEKLAGRISEQIEADSLSLIEAMLDKEFLNKNNFTETSALGMYIPNSYEFYWNTSAKSFRDRMLKEYNRFWNSERVEKAKQQNLSISEVLTLASIVQKETAQKSERPIVAGLYLNRLKNNWPLEADPTIIYAKQQQDKNIVIKRVLFKYIEETKNSPYNTYKNTGLPPSLISMPDISAIDAVLNPKKHNYFFMCASVENVGFHEFASSLSQHNRNAAKYQRWISERGIHK